MGLCWFCVLSPKGPWGTGMVQDLYRIRTPPPQSTRFVFSSLIWQGVCNLLQGLQPPFCENPSLLRGKVTKKVKNRKKVSGWVLLVKKLSQLAQSPILILSRDTDLAFSSEFSFRVSRRSKVVITLWPWWTYVKTKGKKTQMHMKIPFQKLCFKLV